MKKYKRVIVLVFLFAGLFIAPIVVFASSDQFKQKAQEWYKKECKPNATKQESMMCYTYDRVNELNVNVNNLLNRIDTNDQLDASQSAKIAELEERVNNLLATPKPSSTPSSSPIVSYFISDDTWKFNTTAPDNWISSSFNDSGWFNSVAPSGGQCNPSAIGLLINEHGALPMSYSEINWEKGIGYFRKIINLDSLPTSASVRVVLDDDGELYINNHQVINDHDGYVAGIQSVSIDPTFFVIGSNVIGLKVIDSVGGCQHAQVELEITNESELIFSDYFNGTTLDSEKWVVYENNGTYQVQNGILVMPGGQYLPFIRSKYNPIFPTTGPFTIEFGIQYTSAQPSGDGIGVSFNEQVNAYDPNNVPVAFWQDSASGLAVVRFGLTVATFGGVNTDYHVGKIVYDGDKYLVYNDGNSVYTSPSSTRAQSLWMGHPFISVSSPWTGFKLDYIKITTP